MHHRCPIGDHVRVPRKDEDDQAWCSVAAAALKLGGCSTQTVRNLLDRGDLHGERVVQGRRTNIRRVDVRSIEHYLGQHRSPARGRRAETVEDRLTDVEARLQRLEALPPRSNSTIPDPVNLQFANLRLLQIQEGYNRALSFLLAADEQRRAAHDAVVAIAAEYRSIVEQFHLPDTPPDIG